MPLVAHSLLPSFDRLRQQGQEILTLDHAIHQDIRELHIGFLNMMPDSALTVTEQQFMRLVGSCNQIAQFYVHPFSIDGLSRSSQMRSYIDQYYEPFEKLKEEGLDALVLTGANVANPRLEAEPFWKPLQEIIHWAAENTTSILCSCLATHALLQQLYSINRQPLPGKKWGVYSHRVIQQQHPIMRDINTRFDVPHSRYNTVSRAQLEAGGLTILVESKDGGVHMVVSPDQFRLIFMQGHPEYDFNSLLKEYKREVLRFIEGEIDVYPPHPENYFPEEAAVIADEYQRIVQASRKAGTAIPPFPEATLERYVDNTWGDTGKAIFNNWLGLVYQLTAVDRKRAFAPGIDPENPLGLR
ncbi:MAG: homoserine O-succinyltransferase [Acidobacteriota bacterium]|nr:MAG: homoserine O-succinyltransferase [Acidobacteriota bacterium]